MARIDGKNIPIEKLLLYFLAGVGLVGLIALAPGLGLVLKQFGIHKKFNKKTYIPNLLSRMEKKGLISYEGKGTSRFVRITDKGKALLEEKRRSLVHRPKKRAWDGKWRIVIFDIAEKQKKMRDSLRRELRGVGFKKLQQSVWISPDPCEEYIKLLKADRHIGKSLIYIETDTLEYSSSIAKYFQIS